MSIKIEVNDAHAQILIDFYLTRLKALRDEIVVREKEMKEITQIIQTLKKGGGNPEPIVGIAVPSIEYSEKWTWVKKIAFAIEAMNKPLTTKEIVEVLTEFEPSFLIDRKRVVASISSTLSTKSGDGKPFYKVDSPGDETAYGLNTKGTENEEVEINFEEEDELLK